MSCFSRLLGLICAVVPGLIFLAFSVRFFQLWPSLGAIVGPIYSLLSLITGATCLYLGVSILLGGNRSEETIATKITPETATAAPEVGEATEPALLRAAPLPVVDAAPAQSTNIEIDDAQNEASVSQSVFSSSSDLPVSPDALGPLDMATLRIRALAVTRPDWQATAPQLAQLANLNLGVADAAAREMVSNGEAQMQIGPHGETIYTFDLAVKNL